MKKVVVAIVLVFFCAIAASAFDVTFRLSPAAVIPSDGNRYEMGFGGFVHADVDLLGFMTLGIEGNAATVTPKGCDDPVNLLGAGIGAGLYYSPLSRLHLAAGGAFGVYQFSTKTGINGASDAKSASDLYWRGYGELGFRVTPEFTIAATAGYVDYMVSGDGSLFNAYTAGMTFRYTVPIGKSGSSSFSASLEQEDAAFPLFMSAYRNCPLGTLTLRNNEASEIRNVHVSFRAGKYTASTFESANISRINKHSSEEIPLYADFSSEILKYSENGKISGELIVDYELLGKKKQSIQNVVIDMYNRNAFVWADATALASFISPDTPEVQQLAKYMAGIERNSFVPGMNQNLQIAASIFEGLNIAGIKYSGDKSTPYTSFHSGTELDSIQYPLQTMNYLSGDYDDLGILYASCLESVGVPTGFMCLDDDFIVLVGMNVRSGTEQNHFNSVDGLIVDEDNVYFGVSMADLSKGFAKARKSAAKKIAAAKKDTENSHDYVGTHAAWVVYAPATFSGTGSSFENPGQAALEKASKAAVNDYINTDLAAVVARAQKTGDSNKLGVALLRSGKLTEAKAEFGKVNTVSAMNNLANCYMIEKNYSAAASQYKKVLAKDEKNRIALNGLEAANEKLGL